MSKAWILDLGHGRRAAVGEREQFHLMYDAVPVSVALAPVYCRHILIWDNKPMPAIDLGVWMDGRPAQTDASYLGVYGYRERTEADAPVHFGALWLSTPPRRVEVEESAAIPAPTGAGTLHTLALAWFAHEGNPVAIVDLARVFARPLATATARPAQSLSY